MKQNRINLCHVFFIVVVVVISFVTLLNESGGACVGRLSISAVALINLYLISCVAEAALRSDSGVGEKIFLQLPSRTCSLFLVPLCIIAAVVSYAGLFQFYGEIKATVDTAVELTWEEYIYFSAVTLTTLGYGDFVPIDALTRWLVLAELGTGVVLVLIAVSLVASRISEIPSR